MGHIGTPPGPLNCTLCEARKALKHQVKIICEQSHFKDDLLTVNTHGNQR